MSLVNVNIKLDSIWTHLEVILLSLSHQYKRTLTLLFYLSKRMFKILYSTLWTYHLSFNLSFNLWQKKKLSFELFVLQLFGYSVTWLSVERQLCYVVTRVRMPLYCKTIFSMKNSTWRDCTMRGYQKLIWIFFCFNLNYDGIFSANWYYFNSAKCMYIDDWWMQITLVQKI